MGYGAADRVFSFHEPLCECAPRHLRGNREDTALGHQEIDGRASEVDRGDRRGNGQPYAEERGWSGTWSQAEGSCRLAMSTGGLLLLIRRGGLFNTLTPLGWAGWVDG